MSAVDLTNLFSRNFELKSGEIITFDQSAVGDVGCVVWDAALVLCSYIDKVQEKFRGKSVLELGAGTGAAGLVASAIGAKVVITDLPEIVPLMQHNVNLNEKILKGSCTATELKWGNKEHMAHIKQEHFSESVDFLLIADCVYYEAIEELVKTVLYLTSPSTTVLCTYEDRELGNKVELQSRYSYHANYIQIKIILKTFSVFFFPF
ncbi:hypothetical protein Btru_009658 [Bulinus truncatus]|nr:hypothetical protein Btru_009658 [Bulinus truncatus]